MTTETVTVDYTDSMTALLDWFAEQPCTCATIGRIVHEGEYSRETVRQNLKELMAAGHAERMYKETGEYRLIEDPREE